MHQLQSFHTSAYRGNQQGHDAYLRSDSQQATSSSIGMSSFGAPVSSQYRGIQKTFQPTGLVQSVYGQNQPQGQFQNPYQAATQFQNPQSFHAANYRGNQANHDNYLRADSTQPSQSGYASYQAGGQQAGQWTGQKQYGIQSPQSFHTANYRGNQQGHDSYLRSDSTQPSSIGIASGAGYGMGGMQQQYQAQSPQAFHTANYKGNQPGHDISLRADSFHPSQSQSQFGSNWQ